MHISDGGLALIKRFEGFSKKPYMCPAGKWTIGYGHVIQSDEDYSDGIDTQKAENLLKEDISWAEQAIKSHVKISLTQSQFDALVSLIYNIGHQAFEKSSLLWFLNKNQLDRAAEQFSRWVYVNGRKKEGLIRRRAAEKLVFSTET